MFSLIIDILMISAIIIGALLAMVRHLEYTGIFFPSREIAVNPSAYGLPWEDVYFKARGPVTLNGWFFKNPEGRSTLIFAHGNGGNIGDRISRIKFFYDLGLSVFIFDYRGYGKSGGKPSEAGIYGDGRAAYDYLQSRGDVNMDKIILYGTSLGGCVAIDTALKRKTALLVVDSSFTSARDMAKLHYPFIPAFLISLKLNSIDKIRQLETPKLFIHSPQDEIVPYKLGEKLFMAAPGPKQFLKIQGGHNSGLYSPQAVGDILRLLKTKELI